jgi:hypothetical protein
MQSFTCQSTVPTARAVPGGEYPSVQTIREANPLGANIRLMVLACKPSGQRSAGKQKRMPRLQSLGAVQTVLASIGVPRLILQ